MEQRISRLLDDYADSSVRMEETDVVSAMRIKELTNMKINETEARPHRSPRKRILSLALAAALLLALSAVAYAAWSIHAFRQQELKEDLQVVENQAGSYVEYPVPDDDAPGLVLLSTVNDGEEQRVFVNISPVAEEEAAGFPDGINYSWSIEGTEIGGFAGPQLPVDLSVSGDEAIRAAILEYAYHRDTQTVTLECYLSKAAIRRAQAELNSDALPLMVHLCEGQTVLRSFGPVSIAPTAEQRRVFDFGSARYYDEELDKEIEIVGLELTPFSAVWKVRYAQAEQFHSPDADWDAYQDWSTLEDKVCMLTEIFFSDGLSFTTGGALTCPYVDGVVELHCDWGRAINIYDVQRIALGDLVLWEAP